MKELSLEDKARAYDKAIEVAQRFYNNSVAITNEAPKRLYLSKIIYSTRLYQVPDPDDKTAVEYTRTDAFIEKAVSWLKCQDEIVGISFEEDFIERFRKYMED